MADCLIVGRILLSTTSLVGEPGMDLSPDHVPSSIGSTRRLLNHYIRP